MLRYAKVGSGRVGLGPPNLKKSSWPSFRTRSSLKFAVFSTLLDTGWEVSSHYVPFPQLPPPLWYLCLTSPADSTATTRPISCLHSLLRRQSFSFFACFYSAIGVPRSSFLQLKFCRLLRPCSEHGFKPCKIHICLSLQGSEQHQEIIITLSPSYLRLQIMHQIL